MSINLICALTKLDLEQVQVQSCLLLSSLALSLFGLV